MTQTIKLDAGATQADILAGIVTLKSTGGTLVLPKDATITLTSTLKFSLDDQNIKIDLNGSKLVTAGNFRAVSVEGAENPLIKVALAQDKTGNATITYDKLPTDLKVGSFVKITSDDKLPGDYQGSPTADPTRLGQAAEVVAINGNTVILKGDLVDQELYQTNVRASVLPSGQFTLENGTISGATPEYKVSAPDLVHLRSLTKASVNNVTIENGGFGINIVNNAETKVTDLVAKNVWAGVHSVASTDTGVNGLFAETVGHGVIIDGLGTAANTSTSSKYGANVGLHGTNSVVYGASMSAYDNHSETRETLYEDVLAFDSRMLASFRGIGNTVKDSAGAGNLYGVQFMRYGDDDGRYSTVDNVVLRETKAYSIMVSGQVLGNVIKNSDFEHYGLQGALKGEQVAMANSFWTKIGLNKIDDLLIGSKAEDKLLGGQGTDIILGGGGNDYIWGGAGIDQLTGGAGRDRFAFHSLSEAGDVIYDFQTGARGDVLDLSVLAIRMGWARNDVLAQGDVRAVQAGFNTVVQARDEGGKWTTLATLVNTQASKLTAENIQLKLSEIPNGSEPVEPPVMSPPAGDNSQAPIVKPLQATTYEFRNADSAVKSGDKVTIAVNFTEAVKVSGNGLTLDLANGAKATYVSGSGTGTLLFSYKATAGEDIGHLAVESLNLGVAATVRSLSGTALDLLSAGTRSGGAVAVDTVAPTTRAIALDYTDSGVKGDRVTNDTSLTVHGTGEAGSKVQVFDGSDWKGTAVVGADGNWKLGVKVYGDGEHAFTAVETDAAGNRGSVSKAETLVIDTRGPGRATVNDAYSTTITKSDDVILSGKSEKGAVLKIYDNNVEIGTTKAGADGAWSYKASDLDEGRHRLTAAATDAAGNEGATSAYRDFLIDQTAPEMEVTRQAATGDRVQFTGKVSDSLSDISVYDNGKLIGTAKAGYGDWTLATKAAPDKVHTFTFKAVDRAGNEGSMEGSAVLGTKGSDTIHGTKLDDVLTGNGGSDKFDFAPHFGHDTITDFRAGPLWNGGDVIAFDDKLFDSFKDVMADAHQVGTSVVVTIDDHTSLTLERTTLSNLTAQNFVFV